MLVDVLNIGCAAKNYDLVRCTYNEGTVKRDLVKIEYNIFAIEN